MNTAHLSCCLRRVVVPVLLAGLGALAASCTSSSDGDTNGAGADSAQSQSDPFQVAGDYTLVFFTEAGGAVPDTYRVTQDGTAIALVAACAQSPPGLVDCRSLNGAKGAVGSAGDGLRYPFTMVNEQVVITGMFIREAEFVLFDAEVKGTTQANTGRLEGLQPRPVAAAAAATTA